MRVALAFAVAVSMVAITAETSLAQTTGPVIVIPSRPGVPIYVQRVELENARTPRFDYDHYRILARHLARPTAWPSGDLALRKAVVALYGDVADVRGFGERFAPFQNLAAHYLLSGMRVP